MNVSGTYIRPLEGTELAGPHSGLDSQQNCISAWIWNSAFEFFFYAQNLIPCEDLLAGILLAAVTVFVVVVCYDMDANILVDIPIHVSEAEESVEHLQE